MDSDLRIPILLGESGAQVVRVQRVGGSSCIEKSGPASEIAREAAVLRWCTRRLPVARVLREEAGLLEMSDLFGRPLNEWPSELAGELLAEALHQLHALSFAQCPFIADWDLRLREAQARLQAGFG